MSLAQLALPLLYVYNKDRTQRTSSAGSVSRSEVAIIWELEHIALYLLAYLVGMGQQTGLKIPTFPWVLL